MKYYDVVKQERTLITVKNIERGMISIEIEGGGLQFIHLVDKESCKMILCKTTFRDGDIRKYLDIVFKNGMSISLANIVNIVYKRCQVINIPLE